MGINQQILCHFDFS